MPNTSQIKSRKFPKIHKKSKKYQKIPNFFFNFPHSSKALNGPHQYQKMQRILNKSQKIPKKYKKISEKYKASTTPPKNDTNPQYHETSQKWL
jgi:hypothetical protein